ncbi:MAG: tetratricopeptide repeat protein [Mariniblastus sp.]|nr:tetratricopeptide repeat protein [Mariniblastus sp.]
MSNPSYLGFVLICVMGCTSETDVSIRPSGEPPVLTRNQRDSPSITTPQRNTGPVGTDSFTRVMEELTQRAALYEEGLDFEASLKTWEEISNEVAVHFAPDSWQVATAAAGKEFAKKACGFNAEDCELYREARRLNQELAKLLKDRDYALALSNANKSLEILKQLTGDYSANVGRQLLQMAIIKENLDLLEEAAGDFHQGIQLLNNIGFKTHPEIELAHSALAAIYSRANQFPASIANQKLATLMSGKIWGEDSVKYAGQANQLGSIYHRSGDYETALKILRGSVAIRRAKLGADAIEVGHSQLNIGTVLMDMKRFSEALESVKIAEQIFQQTVPRRHRGIVLCHNKLATIYMLQKQYGLAEEQLKLAVRELQQVAHVMPSQMSLTEYQLAISLGRQGKYSQAQPLLEKIISTQEVELGPSHPMTVRSLKAYALVLKQTKQEIDAQRVYDRIQRTAGLEKGDERVR